MQPSLPSLPDLHQGIVLVPCHPDLNTGLFQPLYLVKDYFPELSLAQSKPSSTDPQDRGCTQETSTSNPKAIAAILAKHHTKCSQRRMNHKQRKYDSGFQWTEIDANRWPAQRVQERSGTSRRNKRGDQKDKTQT